MISRSLICIKFSMREQRIVGWKRAIPVGVMCAFRYASALFLAAACLTTAAADLGTLKNSGGGVTVAVTPVNLSAGADTWEFKIVLDTHSGELNDDLLKTATLLDEKGGRHVPTQWEGAGPGGHHREGVLSFKPVSPAPATVELQVRRAGEENPRSFRWQLR